MIFESCLTLLLVASAAACDAAAYAHTQRLASDLALHWRVDGDTLALALVATDVPDGGWIGFGIAPRAQMIDAGSCASARAPSPSLMAGQTC